MGAKGDVAYSEFLSTPSARRATDCRHGDALRHLISIHALREEGDVLRQYLGHQPHGISIHALREEGDRVLSSPSE